MSQKAKLKFVNRRLKISRRKHKQQNAKLKKLLKKNL